MRSRRPVATGRIVSLSTHDGQSRPARCQAGIRRTHLNVVVDERFPAGNLVVAVPEDEAGVEQVHVVVRHGAQRPPGAVGRRRLIDARPHQLDVVNEQALVALIITHQRPTSLGRRARRRTRPNSGTSDTATSSVGAPASPAIERLPVRRRAPKKNVRLDVTAPIGATARVVRYRRRLPGRSSI